jgi:D-arabinonate dehydratase/D-galactarolactone cycloisomerase
MKIVSVKIWPLIVPINDLTDAPVSVPNPEITSGLIFKGYRSVLIQVHTDSGVCGVGEGLTRLAPRATMEILKECSEALIGRDPLETELIWDDLYSLMLNRGHNRGFMLEAIAAIDIALWDIRGKALGLPLFKCLGGSAAPIPCYASSLRIKKPEVTAQEAKELVASGFRGIKLKVGRGRNRLLEDIDSVNAVREAVGPSIRIMVDANCGFSLGQAVRFGRELDRLDITWFEEPLQPENLMDYKILRSKIDTPIAAGETWFTRYDFRDALLAGAFDIAQPDVARSGGITETKKIADLTSAFHVEFAPHTGQSSIVCLTAALHLAASVPSTSYYEFIAVD